MQNSVMYDESGNLYLAAFTEARYGTGLLAAYQ